MPAVAVCYSEVDATNPAPTLSTYESVLKVRIFEYLDCPDTRHASYVVTAIQDLLNDPECIGFPDNRCVYKKMLQQWKARCQE